MRGGPTIIESLIAAVVVSASAWLVLGLCVWLVGLPVPVGIVLWLLALGGTSFIVAGAEA